MAEPQRGRRAVLSPAAHQDIQDLLLWSLNRFGKQAAARYRALLIQALRDIEADPTRPGSRTHPELAENARIYHLKFSRTRTAGQSVKAPRHFILYRISSLRLEIARILHEGRDLNLHVPDEFRP